MKNLKIKIFVVVTLAVLGCCSSGTADVPDFNNWTLVEDPAHPNFGSSLDSASQVTLFAFDGPVPAGTDIGYSSVDGATPATSTKGYYFDPGSDFSIAVDFAMAFSNANGTLAFGFGIGEDNAGENSAGVTLVTVNGSPIAFGAAARINDTTQTPGVISASLQNSARMIVSYDAASGDIVLGVSTDGDDTPEGTHTFSGLQNSWTDGLLTASFFIRSDDRFFSPWQSGTSDTVVTNFHVISGTPFAVVPEPQSMAFLVGLSLCCFTRRSRR